MQQRNPQDHEIKVSRTSEDEEDRERDGWHGTERILTNGKNQREKEGERKLKRTAEIVKKWRGEK